MGETGVSAWGERARKTSGYLGEPGVELSVVYLSGKGCTAACRVPEKSFRSDLD